MMNSNTVKSFATLALLAVCLGAQAKGTGGCDAYTWDLAHEFEVLAQPQTLVASNENVQQSALPLELDVHYIVALHPQSGVAFLVTPGRAARDEAPQGGIAYFHAKQSGPHRIAIDTSHWLDVVDAGANVLDAASARVVPSLSHEGQSGCATLRKVVSFDLEAGKTYRLHFSGNATARVHVVVTRAPER